MLEDVLPLLLEKKRFLITTHVRPDGDAIGSQLALGLFLQKLGKQVAMINTDPIPDNLAWMPGVDAIWNQIWPGKINDYPKYASSVAHVYGKPRAFTESFAAYKPAPDEQQAKWVLACSLQTST